MKRPGLELLELRECDKIKYLLQNALLNSICKFLRFVFSQYLYSVNLLK